MAKSASDIVQSQVDAYNAYDLDRFCSLFCETVQIWDFPDTLILEGKERLRKRYADRFANSPGLEARILDRRTFGAYVIDTEHLRSEAFPEHEAVVIYKVENDLICKVWFLRTSTL